MQQEPKETGTKTSKTNRFVNEFFYLTLKRLAKKREPFKKKSPIYHKF